MYFSTKTYGPENGWACCYRQWRAESHCKYLHGYAISVKVVFEADELDERGWVVDFGGLKSFKEYLANLFDHTVIVASDDPLIEEFLRWEKLELVKLRFLSYVGCEKFSSYIFNYLSYWLVTNNYAPRCRVHTVEVREHVGNSAACGKFGYVQ